MNKYNIFKKLHHQNTPLLLGNVWNAQSALAFQKLGFKAIGTSSAAIATSLGYDDGEQMPFEDLLNIIKNILSKINIPLTVDIEGGYSRNIPELIGNITALQKLGVVGINLEDSITDLTQQPTGRRLVDTDDFSEILKKIKSYLLENNIEIFLNIRTDYYIMGIENALAETLNRIKNYKKNGADGIFVPCIVQESDIQKVVDSTSLPINVMCMPGISEFKKLEELGVKRISFGPFLYNNTVAHIENSIKGIVTDQSFNSLFIE